MKKSFIDWLYWLKTKELIEKNFLVYKYKKGNKNLIA